jgi:hypothetical protein
MKYKALAFSFLLLLSLLVLIPPKAKSTTTPTMYITPKDTKLWGPCRVSTYFNIDVNLFNKKAMTGVGVFAFDFNLTWSYADISIAKVFVHNPWPASQSWVVVNKIINKMSNGNGTYHLAITAVGNSSLELGSTGDFQASLVTIMFHIDSEPCYPDTYSTVFFIYLNGMSTQCTTPIVPELDTGTYELIAAQPNIELECVSANATGCINNKKNCPTFIVEVHLTNISHAYAFGFEIEWPKGYLETDPQLFSVEPAFAGPYELLELVYEPTDEFDPTLSSLTVVLIRPSEKPTLCSPDAYVINIPMHANATAQKDMIPYPYCFYFTLDMAFVWSKGCKPGADIREYWYGEQTRDEYPYTAPAGAGEYALAYTPWLWYQFKTDRADLNFDGTVDIQDVAAVAGKYGKACDWANLVAPGGTVDIFDVVYVAKRFGNDP